MNIIKQSDIISAKHKQPISGVILVMGYEKKMTKGNPPKPTIDGTLCSGVQVALRVWTGDDGTVEKMSGANYSGKVCHIVGEVSIWQGAKSIVVTGIEAVEGFEPSQFLASKYNIDAYAEAFKKLMANVLSEKGYSLLTKILFSNEAIWSKFKTEFCASKHHDNCKGGLLAHSYRNVYILQFLMGLYPSIFDYKVGEKTDRTDIQYIGTGLHDIGKIHEMNTGVYQPIACVTHRQIGCEMLYPYKAEIVSLYGEKLYYDLISIILQHHHIYGDPARTVPAYVAHLTDMIDTQFISLGEKMKEEVTEGVSGDRVFLNKDTVLTI